MKNKSARRKRRSRTSDHSPSVENSLSEMTPYSMMRLEKLVFQLIKLSADYYPENMIRFHKRDVLEMMEFGRWCRRRKSELYRKLEDGELDNVTGHMSNVYEKGDWW